jgi:FKBP-type peptidyl-prolyl cis-trans isomerase FklB
MDKFSYGLGLGIGQQLLSMGAEVSVDDFAQAIRDVLEGKETALSFTEAQQIVNNHFAEMEKKAHAAAIGQGEMFLKMNKERAGVTTLPSGLQYEVLATGTGRKPKATDKVRCHYEGRLVDGTMFDSSIERGEPAVFGVNQVIAGWVEALQLMSEGDKWKLYIPYNLGYGEHGAGAAIPPYSTLVFEVELLEVL